MKYLPWYNRRGTDCRISGMSGLTDSITSGPRATPTFSEQLSNTKSAGTPSTFCSHQQQGSEDLFLRASKTSSLTSTLQQIDVGPEAVELAQHISLILHHTSDWLLLCFRYFQLGKLASCSWAGKL